MEWSKEKTLKLVELLQVNPTLWNPAVCDTRKDKQKRKEELRTISAVLGLPIADITKKIQHLRTQYNRESARESRVYSEDPGYRYISSWYAFDYLHFMKDPNKPFRILQCNKEEVSEEEQKHSQNPAVECKLLNLSPVHKAAHLDAAQLFKSELMHQPSPNRDEFTVFGEYVANELRSLKGEKNLLLAKKKIQDVIFEMKMGLMCEPRTENSTTAYAQSANSLQMGKIFSSAVMSTAEIEPLTANNSSPTSNINEIIIDAPCHFTNFKVDSQ